MQVRNTHPSGDVGRRLALRRQELGLSREDVAQRAGIATAYLRYVEEQPTALPDVTFMLRVANALQTTVQHLHGADAGLPPGIGEAADHPVLTRLARDECMVLMTGHGVGRVGTCTESGPIVVPVNYDVVDGSVVFRTGASGALARTAGHEVAFEVDRIDDALSEGWSTLVVGPAVRVTAAAEIRDLDARAHSTPWAGGVRTTWMRILPRTVTGRRIAAGANRPEGGPTP